MGRTVFMWYKVVLAVASVKIVLKCEHSKNKKSCRAMLCCEARCFYVVQGSASFCVCGNHPTVHVSIKIKAVEQYFAVERAVFMWYKVVLAFASAGIILQRDYF